MHAHANRACAKSKEVAGIFPKKAGCASGDGAALDCSGIACAATVSQWPADLAHIIIHNHQSVIDDILGLRAS
jgi:hypothetical protein